MNHFIKFFIFISLIDFETSLIQNSVIFPGNSRSGVSSSFTDDDQSVNTDIRNTVNRVLNAHGNRRTPMDKGEESRISERAVKKKKSNFDDLDQLYDFSKTDKLHRVSDLLRFLGIEDENRTEAGGLERRKLGDDPTQVGCHTEMRTVDLAVELKKNSEDIKLFPECVKARRCAGCCGFNSGRVCTPIKKEKINVYAAVIRVKRSCDESTCKSEIDKDNLRKMFQIDSHEECACRCKLSEEDCNENQDFDDNTCKCLCKDNESARNACEQSPQKRWSDKNCNCECKKTLTCSTGLVFSNKSCSCARKG